jgi:hypothetical protein
MKKQWIVLTLAVVSALLYVGCKKTQPQSETAVPADSAKTQPSDVIKLTYANFPPAPTFPCVQMERWNTEFENRPWKSCCSDRPRGIALDAKEMMAASSAARPISAVCAWPISPDDSW